ncbi:MAG: PLP-dependent aminotransferase family protein [Anaeromyxobacteraceae bacterium]
MARHPLAALALSRGKGAPLQRQLVAGVKALVQRGAIRPGDALPSTRDLAAELRVSRNTTSAAYDQLVSEGYLEARPRSGVFVSGALAGRLRGSGATGPARSHLPEAPPLPPLASPVAFRPCYPDVRLFPLALWNRCRARALREHGPALLHYQPHPLGLPALRRSLAEYLGASRGVRCSWEQIAITTGSQQALYLLARVLLGPGRPALIEDPGYPGAREAFRSTGADLRPIPVDGDGLVPPARLPRGAVVYTTPSRQFPTGAPLPVARRLALLAAAEAAGAWIVEDDYDSEFRYARAPLPSLHGLDEAGRVVYVGTTSKVLAPALRIGYVVLPPALVERFSAVRTVVDEHGPLLDQATLAAFLDAGAFYGHLRRCRREYAGRLDAFLSVAREVGAPLEFRHADSGMNLLGRFTAPPRDPAAQRRRLAEAGFAVPGLEPYLLEPGGRPAHHAALFFGFSAFTAGALRQAWRRLGPLLAR